MNPEDFLKNTIDRANELFEFPFYLYFGSRNHKVIEIMSRTMFDSEYHIEKKDFAWTAWKNRMQCTLFFGDHRNYQPGKCDKYLIYVGQFLDLCEANMFCCYKDLFEFDSLFFFDIDKVRIVTNKSGKPVKYCYFCGTLIPFIGDKPEFVNRFDSILELR